MSKTSAAGRTGTVIKAELHDARAEHSPTATKLLELSGQQQALLQQRQELEEQLARLATEQIIAQHEHRHAYDKVHALEQELAAWENLQAK
ncbi:MAG TPA: hypothetical protein EYO33_02660 [Phycisphaerales bacterium]|nr:hypothetical protein [Phycisphaerales bacterium]